MRLDFGPAARHSGQTMPKSSVQPPAGFQHLPLYFDTDAQAELIACVKRATETGDRSGARLSLSNDTSQDRCTVAAFTRAARQALARGCRLARPAGSLPD